MQNKPMIYGYALVSTDGQSATAQVATLRKQGAGKVFREVASGGKTDRAQLRRLLDQLDAGDVDGDTARPAGAIHPRPVEHARGDHWQKSRLPLAWRCMGRQDHGTRSLYVDRSGRAGAVREGA